MEMVELQVLFFGALKGVFGQSITISIGKGQKLAYVLALLEERQAEAKDIFYYCQVAINSNIVEREFVINEGCEIAILPPFSGG